jgi:glycosyltransferase involved in cell wall biosynthesis
MQQGSGNQAIRLAICATGEIWGGVEQFVLTLAHALAGERQPVMVILFHDGLLARRLRELPVHVEVLPHGPGHNPRAVAELRAILRRERINLLHVHGYKATIVGALASRSLGVKVVKTEHGRLERPAGRRDVPAFVKLWLNACLDSLVSRWAIDGLVFVSRDIADGASRFAPRVPKRVIYNGLAPSVDVDQAASDPRDGDGAFNIGIVGRLTKVKGHAHLLKALARLTHLHDLRLHVFGTGPLDALCRRLCDEQGLTSRVRFHGFEPAIHRHIAALDLLIIPSEHEGLPYVLLEAMYLKVPIIASRVGGLREVLEEGECGVLVAPRDPVALAAAIEQAYRHPELRTQLAALAHARLRRDFLASGMVRQYAVMYRAVMGS